MEAGGGAHALRAALTRPLARAWKKHPFALKTASAALGFAGGDALTQSAMRRPGEAYDWPRTAAMGAAGLVAAGPLGYAFLGWMEGAVLPSAPASGAAVATKIVLDQVLGGILWQAAAIAISERYRGAAAAAVGLAPPPLTTTTTTKKKAAPKRRA
jgi:hypothetical protein